MRGSGSTTISRTVRTVAVERILPYVPFCGALVWNRAQEATPAVQVHVSFTPDWFAARVDIDMREEWHRDPLYRRESYVGMAKALNREFPRLALGGDPREIRGGLSQIDGCAVMAALFGQEVIYAKEAWPENRRRLIDDGAASVLGPPDFASGPQYADLMRQMDVIEREWGTIDGELNCQGVLNTAFRLRGESIFTDMLTEPARARCVLDTVCETTIRFVDAVYARQAQSGVEKDYFVTSNCVVNMISEEQYRRFILPCDKRLSEHFRHFGIHNCGWKIDAYVRAYAEIRALGYLDFGVQSDLDMLPALHPKAMLTVILNPDDVVNRPAAEVRRMLERIHRSLGTCRIILGSLDRRTLSSDVESFFASVASIWGVSIESLVPRAHCG